MAVLRDDWDWARYLGSLRWDVTDKDGNLIPLTVDVRRGCDAVERIDLMVHSAYVKPFDVKFPSCARRTPPNWTASCMRCSNGSWTGASHPGTRI